MGDENADTNASQNSSKNCAKSPSPNNQSKRCDLCDVEYAEVLQYANHLTSKKHKSKEDFIRMQRCAIFVRDFPQPTTKNDLSAYFAQFGEICKVNMRPYSATVLFLEEKSAQNVLSKPALYFKNRRLTVRKHVPTPQIEERPSNFDKELKILLGKLENEKNFDKQLTTFIDCVEMPRFEMQNKCQLLCQHLETALGQKFYNCKALPFGSTVTGLAYRGSDLDVFVRLRQHLPGYRNDPDAPSNYVKLARSLLYKYQHYFVNIIGIPKAKTPIVKCLHKPTEINCDFNFKNMLGVCNSRLIAFYLSLDDRLRPLVMIIKFWAKAHGFSGCGKLSNYALVMLAVFYLQQDAELSLPTVADLQRDPRYADIQEGWNGGFNYDFKICVVPKKSIPELLRDFFKFYSSFEFTMKVICPFVGRAYVKTDFANADSLPEEYARYKLAASQNRPLRVDTAACVQDPFEHDHNITASVTPVVLQAFQHHCSLARDVCGDDDGLLLARLFKEKPASLENTKEASRKSLRSNYEIAIPASASIATLKSDVRGNVRDDEQALRAKWYDVVNRLLVGVLIDVMKFEVVVQKCSPEHKAQRKNNQSDVHDDDVVESIAFRCVGKSPVWYGRKKAGKSVRKGAGSLEDEVAISDCIDKDSGKEKILDANLFFHAKRNPTRVILEFKNNDPSLKGFNPCGDFLRNFLPKLIEKSIKEKKDIVVNSQSKQNDTNEKNSAVSETTNENL